MYSKISGDKYSGVVSSIDDDVFAKGKLEPRSIILKFISYVSSLIDISIFSGFKSECTVPDC